MKLQSLLKALHPHEHKEFEQYLQSQFYKRGEQYVKFLKLLCKHHPAFEATKTEIETTYKSCFGKKQYTESRLNNLLSDLGKQVERFLSLKMVSDQKGMNGNQLQKELLVKSLGTRNQGAYFRSEAQRLLDEMEAQPVKSLEDYQALHQLHHQVYFNPDTPKYQPHQSSLQSAVEYLDLYYCIAKLRYVAEMKVRERLFQVRYELPMLEAVLDKTAAPELVAAHPLAALYNKLVHLYLRGLNEQDFRELKLLFIEKFPLLPKDDQQLLLRHLINIGVSLDVQGYELNEDLLALYRIAMEANMLLDGNRITHFTFVNIVVIATFCREFDWARDFMDRFSPNLEGGYRKSAIDYSKAILYYGQGVLDQAQANLTADVFMFPSFDIVARALLLKIAFDRYVQQGKDYEFLTAHLNAFEKYVSFKQWSEEKKSAQLNCIRFVRKMAAVKFEMVQVPEGKINQLREKLRLLNPVVSKKWLTDKIESL